MREKFVKSTLARERQRLSGCHPLRAADASRAGGGFDAGLLLRPDDVTFLFSCLSCGCCFYKAEGGRCQVLGEGWRGWLF
jgi:hypothetical protein